MKCRKILDLFAAVLIPVTLLLSTLTPAVAVTPEEVARIFPSPGNGRNEFGYSVGISGDTAVIGAPRYHDSGPLFSIGAAFIFTRNTDGLVCPETGTIDPWCQQATLHAGDPGASDRFGFWVDIDGDTVIVGSRQDDDLFPNSGSAYVFTGSGSTWTQQAKLTASDAQAFARFGTSVAISGNTIVVGSGEFDGVGADSGKAYIYNRTGVTWTEEAILTAADLAAGDIFGHKVAISGETALIAAFQSDALAPDSGAAYIFKRNTAAVACPETLTVDPWCQLARLTASDGAAGDWFGAGVSLSSNTALIGAPGTTPGTTVPGSAYVFVRNAGVWSEQTKLFAPDGDPGDAFGFALDLFGDTAVIAADGDDDIFPEGGSAYTFTRSSGVWTEQSPKMIPSGIAADDVFGWSVSISGDTTILGNPRTFAFTSGLDRGIGSAYLFDLNADETPVGNDVVVAPSPVDENGEPVEDAPEISLAFDTVSGEGETTVTITQVGPPPPGGFGVIGETGSTYIELETTATFEGLVEVCIDYSNFELTVPPASLAFAHFVDGVWVDITSSNDLVNMILCGQTSSFSFFGIFAVENPLAILDGLDAAVAALDAKKGTIKSLQSKLKTVRKKLTDGNPDNDIAAANVLMNAFVNKIEARRGKDISDADANALISTALTLAAFIHP